MIIQHKNHNSDWKIKGILSYLSPNPQKDVFPLITSLFEDFDQNI
jgi:hypothetical protein